MFTCCCHKAKVEDRHLFLFGLGYLGKALAVQLVRQGWKVTGTKKTESVEKEILESGVEVIPFDTESSDDWNETLLQKLNLATHLLVCIPANQRGDPLLSKLGLPNLQKHKIRWVGYISSTVVYEASDSMSWIDENAPLAIQTKKASYYIAAEEQWKRWTKDFNIRLMIFRLSALYGPSRSALDTLLRMQSTGWNIKEFFESSSFAGDVMVSRIHQMDACEKIATSMLLEWTMPGNLCIVNLSDNLPCTRAECFDYAFQLLDEDTIKAWRALHKIKGDEDLFTVERSWKEVGKQMRTRITEHKKGKRILNQKMKALFGESLYFPTFFQGLLQVKNDILRRSLSEEP